MTPENAPSPSPVRPHAARRNTSPGPAQGAAGGLTFSSFWALKLLPVR